MKSVIIATLLGVVALHLASVESIFLASKIAKIKKTQKMIASFTQCMLTAGTFPPLDISTPEGQLLDKLRTDLHRLSQCTIWTVVICGPVNHFKVSHTLMMLLVRRPVLITEVAASPFKCAFRLMCFFKIGLVPIVKCDHSANFLGLRNDFGAPPGPVPPSPFGPNPPPIFEVPFPNQPAPPFGAAMDPNAVPNPFNPMGSEAPGSPPFMPNFVPSNMSQLDPEFQQSNPMGSPNGPSFDPRPPQGPFGGQGNSNSPNMFNVPPFPPFPPFTEEGNSNNPNMFSTTPSTPDTSQSTEIFDTPPPPENSRLDDFLDRPSWSEKGPLDDSTNPDENPKSSTEKFSLFYNPEFDFDNDLFDEIGNDNKTKEQTANDSSEFDDF